MKQINITIAALACLSAVSFVAGVTVLAGIGWGLIALSPCLAGTAATLLKGISR